MNYQRGFSLLEIFFALWLGSILSISLITVFITFYHSWYLQIFLNEVQQKGAFISYFLSKKIHAAGNASCINHEMVNQDKMIRGHDEWLELGECIFYHEHQHFMQTQYFVADSNRKDNSGASIYSLYMKTIPGEREELIENVKKLTFRYGIFSKKQNGIIAYLSANQVSDWHLVRSVEATLVFRDNNREKSWYIYANLRERN